MIIVLLGQQNCYNRGFRADVPTCRLVFCGSRDLFIGHRDDDRVVERGGWGVLYLLNWCVYNCDYLLSFVSQIKKKSCECPSNLISLFLISAFRTKNNFNFHGFRNKKN